jgi:hypothetical protein
MTPNLVAVLCVIAMLGLWALAWWVWRATGTRRDSSPHRPAPRPRAPATPACPPSPPRGAPPSWLFELRPGHGVETVAVPEPSQLSEPSQEIEPTEVLEDWHPQPDPQLHPPPDPHRESRRQSGADAWVSSPGDHR